MGRALLDWLLIILTVASLLFAMSHLVTNQLVSSLGLFVLFGLLLSVAIWRTNQECAELGFSASSIDTTSEK